MSIYEDKKEQPTCEVLTIRHDRSRTFFSQWKGKINSPSSLLRIWKFVNKQKGLSANAARLAFTDDDDKILSFVAANSSNERNTTFKDDYLIVERYTGSA